MLLCQVAIFFGFVIFEVLDNKLSFCEIEASGERCSVFLWKKTCFVVEDLHHIQSHVAEERKNRKSHKAIAQTALEAPRPPLPWSAVCQFTLSAYWPLAIRMTVSPPLSLPLKFPLAGTRGNGPFCAVYRSKVKAAISPSESYWNVTCSEHMFGNNKVMYSAF